MDRVDLFYKLLDLLKTSNRYQYVSNMMSTVFERFNTAPASTRIQHHNCYEGGLLDHTNMVTLKMLGDLKFYSVPLYSAVIAGLCHDLGKVGSEDAPYYQPAEAWQKNSGIHYVIPPEMKILPHAARSIHLLGRFNVQLTEHEFQAILYHNMQPEDSGCVKYYETPLLHLLHQADMYVCWVFEKAYNQDATIQEQLINLLNEVSI